MASNPWTDEAVAEVIRLRRELKPKEIALMTGRSESSVHRLLSVEKKKRGLEYPKLRHGNLKYDRIAVSAMRALAKSMTYKEIGMVYHVHPVIISTKFAQDNHGELVW